MRQHSGRGALAGVAALRQLHDEVTTNLALDQHFGKPAPLTPPANAPAAQRLPAK